MKRMKAPLPIFVQYLQEGKPISLHTLDGEFVTAVKLLGINSLGNVDFLDIQDDEGDWQSINISAIDYAIELKGK